MPTDTDSSPEPEDTYREHVIYCCGNAFPGFVPLIQHFALHHGGMGKVMRNLTRIDIDPQLPRYSYRNMEHPERARFTPVNNTHRARVVLDSMSTGLPEAVAYFHGCTERTIEQWSVKTPVTRVCNAVRLKTFASAMDSIASVTQQKQPPPPSPRSTPCPPSNNNTNNNKPLPGPPEWKKKGMPESRETEPIILDFAVLQQHVGRMIGYRSRHFDNLREQGVQPALGDFVYHEELGQFQVITLRGPTDIVTDAFCDIITNAPLVCKEWKLIFPMRLLIDVIEHFPSDRLFDRSVLKPGYHVTVDVSRDLRRIHPQDGCLAFHGQRHAIARFLPFVLRAISDARKGTLKTPCVPPYFKPSPPKSEESSTAVDQESRGSSLDPTYRPSVSPVVSEDSMANHSDGLAGESHDDNDADDVDDEEEEGAIPEDHTDSSKPAPALAEPMVPQGVTSWPADLQFVPSETYAQFEAKVAIATRLFSLEIFGKPCE